MGGDQGPPNDWISSCPAPLKILSRPAPLGFRVVPRRSAICGLGRQYVD